MARKPTLHVIPHEGVHEDFRRSRAFPENTSTLELIIEGLLHRFDSSESQYLRIPIKALAVLEKGRLPKHELSYHLAFYAAIQMLLSGKPQSSHSSFALHAQKALLVNRLKSIEATKDKDIRTMLKEEDKQIIEELTACPCYCAYRTSLSYVWTRPRSATDDLDLPAPCEINRGVGLIHVILGELHGLSDSTVEDILKVAPPTCDAIDRASVENRFYLRTF